MFAFGEKINAKINWYARRVVQCALSRCDRLEYGESFVSVRVYDHLIACHIQIACLHWQPSLVARISAQHIRVDHIWLEEE